MNYKTTGELKAIAREQLKGKYGTVILIMIVYSVVSFVFSMINSFFLGESMVSFGITVIIMLLTTVLSLGIVKLFLNIAREEEFGINDLFWGFKNHPDKIIVVTILLFLLELVPAVVMTVFIVFFAVTNSNFALILMVVGCIAAFVAMCVIGFMYALVTTILADDKELSAIEAMRLSRELMKGNKLRYFYLSLTFIGWMLLGMLSFGIAYLWIMPYMSLTTVHFYLDLREKNMPTTQNFSEEQFM